MCLFLYHVLEHKNKDDASLTYSIIFCTYKKWEMFVHPDTCSDTNQALSVHIPQ